MKLVLIPAGEFMMGSPASGTDAENDEKPQHRVGITKPFYLAETAVTHAQWRAVMNKRPWSGQNSVKLGADYPATYVSWDEAVEFCQKLSTQDGREYRLPTEAEWEYACRAGATTTFSFGNDDSRISDYAWSGDVFVYGSTKSHAREVGKKRPNAWDLYDMHGNVWEWCNDWYGDKYYGDSAAADPQGPGFGSDRVLRGGGWSNAPAYCRSASRSRYSPDSRFSFVGFRPVLVP